MSLEAKLVLALTAGLAAAGIFAIAGAIYTALMTAAAVVGAAS